MVRFTALLSAAAAAQAALATPIRARTPYAVKESHYVPRQWSNTGPAPESHVIHLHIGLKQSQFDELERHLYEGASPLNKIMPVLVLTAADQQFPTRIITAMGSI